MGGMSILFFLGNATGAFGSRLDGFHWGLAFSSPPSRVRPWGWNSTGFPELRFPPPITGKDGPGGRLLAVMAAATAWR